MFSLPKTTDAAILVAQKKPLDIKQVKLPQSLDIGQVLVELYFSGICGSQLGEIEGIKGEDKWIPHLLGHEGSGKVLAIGPGVTRFERGNKVVAHWRVSEGIESPTPKYSLGGNPINAGWVTTFNRYAVISENRLTKVPDFVDMKTAALFGCAITTGFGTIENLANLKLGDTVVVFGSGGIGLNLIQAASLAGGGEIIAVDKYDNRLMLAKKLGATKTINSTKESSWEILSRYTAENSIDIFIDNTGNTEIISKGYSLIKSTGKVLLVGVPKYDQHCSFNTLPLHFGKSIRGTHGGESQPHIDIPRYINLAKVRNINFSNIITNIGSLEQINVLIEEMRSGDSSGRCLVDLRK